MDMQVGREGLLMSTDLAVRIGSGVICNSSDGLDGEVLHLPGTSRGRGIVIPKLNELVEEIDVCRCVNRAYASGPHIVLLALGAEFCDQSKTGSFVDCIPVYHGDVALNIGQVEKGGN
jgi:hypothetical protein